MIDRLRALAFRLQNSGRRWRRAFAYATGRLSRDDAQWILIDCTSPAGWHTLTLLATGDVRDMAVEMYGDVAQALDPYLDGACENVACKWDTPGDDVWHARQWALDKAIEWAAEDGIHLASDSEPSQPDHQGDHAHA
jgi:hypothetical protein